MSAIGSRPKLVAVRSPERRRLADAIERHRGALADLQRIQVTQQRHFDEVRVPAQKALDVATAALEELKASESRILAATFLGDDAEATSLADAQHTLHEAKAVVERGEKTRQGLAQREREAEAEFQWAERSLRDAHREAVKADPALATLLARFQAAQRELAKFTGVLESLTLYIPHGSEADIHRDYPPPFDEIDAWRNAIARLREDADAPLP